MRKAHESPHSYKGPTGSTFQQRTQINLRNRNSPKDIESPLQQGNLAPATDCTRDRRSRPLELRDHRRLAPTHPAACRHLLRNLLVCQRHRRLRRHVRKSRPASSANPCSDKLQRRSHLPRKRPSYRILDSRREVRSDISRGRATRRNTQRAPQPQVNRPQLPSISGRFDAPRGAALRTSSSTRCRRLADNPHRTRTLVASAG
jgi:hypothetical protein